MSHAVASTRYVPLGTSHRALVPHRRRVSSTRRSRPIAFLTVATAAADDAADDPNLDPEAHTAVYASDTWGPFPSPLHPLDPRPPLLSFDVARALLEAKAQGETHLKCTLSFSFSDDVDLRFSDEGVFMEESNGTKEISSEISSESTKYDILVTWEDIEEISKDEKGAYVLEKSQPAQRFQAFSEGTSRACSLMPSGVGFAPTALLAGFSMHRFGVGVDPMEDTGMKLAAVHPIRPNSRVLDICTGLAYTASGAAEKGAQVTTIELDRAMTIMCQMNPHSHLLFSGQIRQLYGNGADVVPTLPDNSFDRIIHDPPTFALAGELFSEEFYKHLLRILKPNGVLYHYIGDPASKSAGQVAKGAVARLKKAGFGGVVIDYEAHGIVAAAGRVKVGNRNKNMKNKKPDKQKGDSKPKPKPEKRGRRGRSSVRDEDNFELDNEFF